MLYRHIHTYLFLQVIPIYTCNTNSYLYKLALPTYTYTYHEYILIHAIPPDSAPSLWRSSERQYPALHADPSGGFRIVFYKPAPPAFKSKKNKKSIVDDRNRKSLQSMLHHLQLSRATSSSLPCHGIQTSSGPFVARNSHAMRRGNKIQLCLGPDCRTWRNNLSHPALSRHYAPGDLKCRKKPEQLLRLKFSIQLQPPGSCINTSAWQVASYCLTSIIHFHLCCLTYFAYFA
jgi:hypothetical protein